MVDLHRYEIRFQPLNVDPFSRVEIIGPVQRKVAAYPITTRVVYKPRIVKVYMRSPPFTTLHELWIFFGTLRSYWLLYFGVARGKAKSENAATIVNLETEMRFDKSTEKKRRSLAEFVEIAFEVYENEETEALEKESGDERALSLLNANEILMQKMWFFTERIEAKDEIESEVMRTLARQPTTTTTPTKGHVLAFENVTRKINSVPLGQQPYDDLTEHFEKALKDCKDYETWRNKMKKEVKE